MSKVHAHFKAVPGHTPAMCNRNLIGMKWAVYFAAARNNRCELCEILIVRHGYSIKGLEARYSKEREEARKYYQLSRGD